MSRRQVRQVGFDGAALRAVRLRAGYTQENLARAIDMTVRTVQRWEDGETEPNGSTLLALCSVLGVAPDALFRDDAQAVA